MTPDPPATRHPRAVHFPACGVYVIESHHADDFRMEFTEHTFAKFLYVFEGRGRILSAGSPLKLGAGWTAFVPPGRKHRLVDEEPLALYVLCLRPEVFPPGFGAGGSLRSTAHPALKQLAGKVLREMLYEQSVRHSGWELVLTGLAMQLLGGWIRWQSETSQRFGSGGGSASRQRVEAFLAETAQTFYRRESLENAARRCGLGVRRFTQIFRELTGTSWLAYLRKQRIDHARHLLRATTRSVISICFECGFEDLSNFYRAFQQAEHLSPQRWRERQRDPTRSTRRR